MKFYSGCRIFLFLPVLLRLSGVTSDSRKSLEVSSRRGGCRRIYASTTSDIYPLGRFGMVRKGLAHNDRMIVRLKKSLGQLVKRVWNNKMRLFHFFIFMYYTRDSMESIATDSWEAERNPDKFFGKRGILQSHERDVVRRRVTSSRTIRKLVGAGYTPRLVWLYGVMLRGIIHCTALPKIFEPTIGWGAGSVFAARFTYREWLPVIMLGWFGSTYYWKTLFGVDGPPNPADASFDGFPIAIHKVQL
ncbi:hypothetical protein IV203_006178 [Nitzschia inconspicua]|uniref:Uncharacterized protein n=1 Tax=Nitzschia inconspicua TaxID=303405 RepID=A0A9K3K4Q5_9STRA|nr:hypothetical protein IV203_030466 [Nitzschia inconspicua]KAG7347109.1 hypothetical protein IV203_006178 [Nitzschia inconspicua]